jgi:hypothetical protein
MMRRFDTQVQRLELKYVVDEPTAARIRRDIESYCGMDEHCAAGPGGALGVVPRSYLVHTLYLDTPSLAFHRSKERGDPERFKLRVRSYSGRGATVFELKRRSQDIIDKTRALVDPGSIEAAARGSGKPLDDRPETRHFLSRFSRLVATTGAEPSLLVRYWREAYASRVDTYTRVTFDRRVAVQRTSAWDHRGYRDRWCELEHHLSDSAPRPFVILEFKCPLQIPNWVLDLVRRYDLRRQSVSKYSIGIYMTGWRTGAPSLVRRCGGVLH